MNDMVLGFDAECPFCLIISGYAPAQQLRRWGDTVAFRPIGGVNDGHLLVVPALHFSRPHDNPEVFGTTCMRAAGFADELGADYNLIVNAGPEAGQTVFHLHVHLLPRSRGDRVPMPWDEHDELS